MSHDELVEAGRRWLLHEYRNYSRCDGRGACSLVITEMVTGCRETPDVLGFFTGGSVLIECKMSKSDFVADSKKVFRRYVEMGMGMYRYFLAPKGLLSEKDLPSDWGLLEYNGGKVFLKVHSNRFQNNHKAEISVLVSTMRRLKIEESGHVAVRAYTLKNDKVPKATISIVEQEGVEDGE